MYCSPVVLSYRTPSGFTMPLADRQYNTLSFREEVGVFHWCCALSSSRWRSILSTRLKLQDSGLILTLDSIDVLNDDLIYGLLCCLRKVKGRQNLSGDLTHCSQVAWVLPVVFGFSQLPENIEDFPACVLVW